MTLRSLGHKLTGGFTLIELMVVMAIIGILSAIVLAALNTPQKKGGDAAVKANLRTIASQAQFFLDTNSRFNTDGTTGVGAGNTCPTTGNTMFAFDNTIKAAISAAGIAGGGGNVTCYMDNAGTKFVVWAPLKTGQYWCIDQTGISRQEPAAQTVLNLSCP